MREKYSNGFHASVFRVEPIDSLHFSRAELVRVDQTPDRRWFARLFYRHKIASLLFPQNFPSIVASTMQMTYQPKREEKIGIHSLFSVEVDVDPNHALFSAHMRLVAEKGWIRKRSTCSCDACTGHREVHESMTPTATRLARQISRTGMKINSNDPSDYCLSDGQILFFEIDDFQPRELRKYLESIDQLNLAQGTALSFLNRHDELYEASRQDMRTGKSFSLRLN